MTPPITTPSRLMQALISLALCIVLGACLSLGKKPEQTVYSPQVAISTGADWPSVDWPLLVMRPLASDALDTARIVVRPQPGTLQVYQGAAWSDPAPDLLQAALVGAFEDSGKIVAVGRQGSGLRGDFSLLLDMRQFEAVYESGAPSPAAVIQLQAKLLGKPGNRVLAAKTFRVAVPANSKDVPAVVAAFDSALNQSIAQIVGWTLVTGQANVPATDASR